MPLHPFDRRSFLIGGATLATLVACGNSGLEPQRLGVRFPDGFRAPSVAVAGHGPQRFPFVLIANDGLPMISNTPPSIEIEVLRGGETITTETVTVRGEGQFTPFYPLVFTPPEAGSYLARTEFSDIDVEFVVVERSETTLFQNDEKLPAFDTPTFADPRGVNPVCTRSPEPCPFHNVTLTEAQSNGKPSAVLIATPSFCQTDVCASNVEWLMQLGSTRDDLNVIHIEVYEDFERDVETGALPTRAPLLEAWDFAFEPSFFVLDASGTIIDGRHFAFDRDEMEEMLGFI
jgi:hypothetical protein